MPPRTRAIPLAIAALVLAGCFGSPGASQDGAPPSASPILSCPAPCARAIDAGVRWEPSVAVDPLDPLHIVASSQDQGVDPQTRLRRSWPLSHVTFDGGETWRTARLPGGPTAAPSHPFFRYDMMDDSTVAFLPDGTLLWAAIGRPNALVGYAGLSLLVWRSTDGGLTFPDAVVVAEGGGATVGGVGVAAEAAAVNHDKQWFAIEPDGTAILAWSRNLGGSPDCPDPSPLEECTDLVFSTSTDGGRSWSQLGLIEKGLLSGAFPLVREDGAWVVAFRDTARREARVAISEDRGATWSASVVDATTKFPVLAKTTGPAGARIFMAYPASAAASHDGGPQVVTLRWSDDGGVVGLRSDGSTNRGSSIASWSAPVALDDPTHDGRTIPAIAAIGDGAVIVTFWHVLEKGAELRAVAWRDGALSEPIVLGTTDGTTRNVGDYMGLASLPDGSAFAVWTAQRSEGSGVYAARVELG